MCSISSTPLCHLLLLRFQRNAECTHIYPAVLLSIHYEHTTVRRKEKNNQQKEKIVRIVQPVEKLNLIASSLSISSPDVHTFAITYEPYIYKFIYIDWIKITFEHRISTQNVIYFVVLDYEIEKVYLGRWNAWAYPVREYYCTWYYDT